jgi:hypothetical protein
MLSLKWGFSKARIWLDELPNWHYKGTEIVERQLDSTMLNPPLNESSAIELFVPIGGRFYYGALAMTFVPASVGPLVIQVPILESEDLLQDTLLGNKLDTVLIGLFPEYANGIFDGILNTVTAQLLGSGTLYISGAAHGAIGSSPWIFQVLSRISVKLLTLEKKNVSGEQPIKLIREELGQASKIASYERSFDSIMPA